MKNYINRSILIIGHTALAGSRDSRIKLSLGRAAAVAEYLIKENSINPVTSAIAGKGAEEPLGDNNTFEGRKKNRRVEIYIFED